MKITNKMDLPQAFVQMAQSDYKPTPQQYSVTTLLKGVREVMLERRHGDSIEQDVSDMIWLLFGTAVHGILERQQESDTELKETFATMPVGEYKLSGRFDLYDAETQTVTDYKTASVWKITFKNYDDWKKQLLMYAAIMKYCGFPVKRGQIVALLKDQSKAKAKYDRSYPQLPVQVIKFKFADKDFSDINNFITGRFEEIAAAEKLPDDDLPVCTAEERFNTGDKYAVMRKGRKTALRVLDSLNDAEQWMTENGGDSIDVRKGEDKKCRDYCSACAFCNYYREHVLEG